LGEREVVAFLAWLVKERREAASTQLQALAALPFLYRHVLELAGHRDVSTTMIYTHVLNRGRRGVRSPRDGLAGGWAGCAADSDWAAPRANGARRSSSISS
jgi:hypothetical protein